MINRLRSLLVAVPLLLAACASFQQQETRCPVHDLPLQSELVPLKTGAPRYEYEKARSAGFPYPGTAFSGDIRPSLTQEHIQARVCTECRKAESGWLRENRWR